MWLKNTAMRSRPVAFLITTMTIMPITWCPCSMMIMIPIIIIIIIMMVTVMPMIVITTGSRSNPHHNHHYHHQRRRVRLLLLTTAAAGSCVAGMLVDSRKRKARLQIELYAKFAL